jgi:molybdate/tungstate transport system ATP-binding protein
MLEIVDLKRKAGDFVLHIESLSLSKGDFMVLLGPSGSGKTMLLELISGLERCDSGRILLDENDITTQPSGHRGVGMVFQKQWLFPHLTVFENIAYGLRSCRLGRAEIKRRVLELAAETQCDYLLHRKADLLSGGEAQRVAIARTLTLNPKVLLLDEPMANLDSSLRYGIASLIRQLNRKGQTIIYVTHDYSEAAALASAVAVMHNGSIVQQGSLKEVFSRPRSAFVAGFVGIRNFLRGVLTPNLSDREGLAAFQTGKLTIWLQSSSVSIQSGSVSIDAKAITLSADPVSSSAVNQFKGVVMEMFDTSEGVEVNVDVLGTPFNVLITAQSAQRFQIKQAMDVYLQFKAGAVRFEPD